ncbi:MAG: penicillin-insensitive murein endopeptidase [Minicystis sp.]
MFRRAFKDDGLHAGLALALLVLPACAAPLREAPPAPPPAPPVAVAPPAPTVALAPASAPAPADDGAASAAAAVDEELAALDDDVDDEEAASPRAPRSTPQSPFLALSDAELEAKYKQDPQSLGPISAGRAGAGVLVNGVQMPRSERWVLLDPGRAYGTRETVDALTRIIERVNERFPNAPALPIGHLSAQKGGHLRPHVSHQSGRDADIGYYYRTPIQAFVTATADNLDMPRTWTLVKAAIRETDVEMILMDRSIQRLLVDYAATNGEDPAFIDEVFQIRGKNARAPIRHIKGHHNHLHFRFHNPVAEELGRRLARFITVPKAQPVTAANHTEVAGVTFVPHRARNGDTMVVLAKRYGCTVEDIQRANGLRSIALKAGTVYRIPTKAPPKAAPAVASRGGKPPAVARKQGPGKQSGAGRGASSPQR